MKETVTEEGNNCEIGTISNADEWTTVAGETTTTMERVRGVKAMATLAGPGADTTGLPIETVAASVIGMVIGMVTVVVEEVL